MKKIILGAALAFVSMSLTSCLHDNEDLFDKPAAERMEEAVKADKELLESASNGWQMQFYTGEQYSGGGYTMFMKFKSGKAYVSSDIAPAEMVTSSSYDVVTDHGPVLTFNTHNLIMHYLAQPSQGNVEGEQGDYEFIIMKTTQDSIYVKGKKWGNKFVMTRVPEDESWKESISKMQNVTNNMNFAYLPENAVNTDDAVLFDPDLRRIYTNGDTSIGTSFYATTDGLAFLSPVTIAGKQVSELKFDATTQKFSSVDGELKLESYFPEGYQSISGFYGSWNMTFDYEDPETGQISENMIQTFSFQPMSTLINQVSETKLYGTFSIGDYHFATLFSYSPIYGYLSLKSYMFASPLSELSAMVCVPGYEVWDEKEGKYVPRIADGNVNFMQQRDGSFKVIFDDPNADRIYLLGLTSDGKYAIVFTWKNPSDFVPVGSGAKGVDCKKQMPKFDILNFKKFKPSVR